MKKDARFYFGNLLSDVTRCIEAALTSQEPRYVDSLSRSYKTVGYLRDVHYAAYDEGLLLLRALSLAKARGTLPALKKYLVSIAPLTAPKL